MSNNTAQANLKNRSTKSKFKLPLIFWFSMLSFAFFIVTIVVYIISQNEQRVTQAAKISANGLASFVSDYVEKHQLIVKSIAYHHQDRILQLSKGAGYPYDLAEIASDVTELFPADTEFAVINHKGKIIVGSHVEDMGPKCRRLIQESIHTTTPSIPRVNAHQAPDGGFHFDILFPITVVDEWAGLWVKLSFKPLERFIVNLNIQEYELVISEQFPPYKTLLGDHPEGEMSSSKISVFFNEMDSKTLGARPGERALAIASIDNVAWQVRAIQRNEVFDEYVHNVVFIALLLFIVVFIITTLLYLFFRQLQEERERIKQAAVHDQLFNAGPTILLEKKIDRNMSILYASPNVESLLGKDSKSLVEHSFIEWIHVDDVDEVRQKLLTAYLENQDKVEMVYRLKASGNGSYKWIYDLSHILYNRAGKPEILRGYITSIHAQKTAEKNATDLIQSVPEAIFVINFQGRILNANTAAESLLKCQKSDLQNKLFSLWLEAESFAIYDRLKQHYLNNKTLLEDSYRENAPLFLRNAIGQRVSVEIGFNQIELNGENFLVQVVRDITLQQQTQQQLSLAKERAEALAKARSRFVATISHEIRTPMNGVLGMADLLFDTPLNTTQTQYLHAIKQSGDILLKIINEVLDFAKLDEGQVFLIKEKVALQSLVEETLHLLSTTSEEKSITLKYDYADNLPKAFLGDSMRIQQLLMNLIGNALKFTEKGEVLVRVRLVEEYKNTTDVMIEVIDSGIGIAEEHLDKLFDSFTQADGSTSRKFGGTGLGLAICKQLVELMGGEIGVTSELNKGSCFWVKLPFENFSKINMIDSNSSYQVEDTSHKNAQELPLLGKHILLVEDNLINQNVIDAFLQRLGAKVDIADNGLKGVDYWRLNPKRYHLIIMDCQMPVMDGFEATKMIRKEERLANVANEVSHIPILALTANVMVQDKKRCLQAGMDDFLAKPIEKDSFNEMVITWCL